MLSPSLVDISWVLGAGGGWLPNPVQEARHGVGWAPVPSPALETLALQNQTPRE